MSNLDATIREGRGKGAARRLRSEGMIPAIVYGGKDEAISISTSPKYLTRVLMGPFRRNTVIKLNIEGAGVHTVMVRDLQKNVVRRNPTHVDFIKVSDAKPVMVSVPFLTEGRSKSVVSGGKLSVTARSIRLNVIPSKIPENIIYDVTDTPFGTLRAGALTLPEGCELFDDVHMAMLTIKTPRGTTEDEEEGGETPAVAAAE